MKMYVSSSEFWDEYNILIDNFNDQEIWNLVGNAPIIFDLHDIICKYAVWPGTEDTFNNLCKILADTERIIYERLARKEARPSEIMEDPDSGGTLRSSSSSTWYPIGEEETAPDPTRI